MNSFIEKFWNPINATEFFLLSWLTIILLNVGHQSFLLCLLKVDFSEAKLPETKFVNYNIFNFGPLNLIIEV